MKKDFIFAPIIILIGILLFLLRATGMTAHIIISVVGIAMMVTYTALTRKEWKLPALEIIMRVAYVLSFITGIVILNVHGILVLSIAHKFFAALFAVALIVLTLHKTLKKKA